VGRSKYRPNWLNYLIYLAVRLVVCVAQALPLDTARRLGRFIGSAAFRLDRRHRKIARDNLTAAYPDTLSDRQAAHLAKRVFQHFAMLLMEIVHIPRIMRLATWRRYVRLVDVGPFLKARLKRRGMMVVMGHFGNWEMAGYACGMFGVPYHSVARPLDNPYLEGFLGRFRRLTGQTLIAKRGGSEAIEQVLRRGETLAVLFDQDAGPRGAFVEFFGRPASAHKGVALMAIQHNAPVAVSYSQRIGNRFFYEAGIEEIIEPGPYADDADGPRRLAQRMHNALERIVRRAPEQYLWLHRRWKSQPKPGRFAPVSPEPISSPEAG